MKLPDPNGDAIWKKRLPTRYDLLSPPEKRAVRARYAKIQHGYCFHCNEPLSGAPCAYETAKGIDWDRFPKNFLDFPVHLHHDHTTLFTLGAVHAYCNAVLWQYHNK